MERQCRRCMKLFEEFGRSIKSPLEEFSEIFRSVTEMDSEEDLCPACREKLGMMTLLGSDE